MRRLGSGSLPTNQPTMIALQLEDRATVCEFEVVLADRQRSISGSSTASSQRSRMRKATLYQLEFEGLVA